jgi:hypothetical protein
MKKQKRILPKRTNKFASMTRKDMKEMNDVSKRGRGLSSLTLKDIFSSQ